MIDREKVINGLECCMSESRCYKCPYKDEDECENGKYYYSKAIEDAITLLYKQESVKPDYDPYYQEWSCGNCGKIIIRACNFCPYCGREVKWE